jgi:hypothetical protein
MSEKEVVSNSDIHAAVLEKVFDEEQPNSKIQNYDLPEVIEYDDETDETEYEEESTVEDYEDEETIEEMVKNSLKIKYNHKEMEIPYEEAIPLVQKGMNYDKLQEKLQSFENNPALMILKNEANNLGLSLEEYGEMLIAQKEEQEVMSLIEKDIPEELAREILEARRLKEMYQQKEEEVQVEKQQEKDFLEFVNMFPSVNPEDISPETWLLVEQGVPLKYAYMEQEYQQLSTKQQKAKQIQQNKQKSPVRSMSSHGFKDEADDLDPFMKGFNSI